MHRNDAYILWLTRIEGLGSKKVISLIDHFPEIKDVFTAPRDAFFNLPFLTEQNINNIFKARDESLLKGYITELNALGASFITICNPEYPSLLKEIYDPPAGFYMLGEMPDDSFYKLSIIGSRRCSEYGLTVSRKIARELAPYDVVIVSGMAKGIDSASHRGVLEGGGKTVAVLGCGVDICYPSENKLLCEQIINNGCVISEYPPKTMPMPGHFPARNRIISGLSVAVVVVEAAERSGTLITVEQALEQGREVFAVPGNVTNKLSRGTNGLIKQGAALVESHADILNLLNISEKNIKRENLMDNTVADLAPEELIVYNLIGHEAVSMTDIIEKSNCQVQTAQYILMMLEIKGCVRKLPGQRYIRS